MKILFVYASAGFGHRRAAEALYSYAIRHHKDSQFLLIDICDYTNRLFRFGFIWGYQLLVIYAPWLWGFLFRITCLPFFARMASWGHYYLANIFFARYKNFILRENPDWIVSTHFLPSQIKIPLRNGPKVATVITDYVVHPFWKSPRVHLYMVASAATAKGLEELGVDRAKIRITGIPIAEEFIAKTGRSQILQRLGLRDGLFTVLITTGYFGIGPVVELVKVLNQQVQFIVVCAKNKRLFSFLQKKKYPNCRVFQVVNNIHELMDVSQCIIAKPGGLTIAESLAKGVYPLFVTAIPGQETGNLAVLASYGIGFSLANPSKVVEEISRLKNDSSLIDGFKAKAVFLARPYAVKEILDALCQGSSGVAR